MPQRVALVTGGTRGIGAAISRALAAAGHKVAATYAFNEEAAARFREETGLPAHRWDVGDFEACQAGIRTIEAELGPVDILVNNAGITRDGFLHTMTPDQWRDVLRTNLDGLFNMTRPVMPGMRERGFGRVIVISSVNAQRGQMGQANYAASKAGHIGFIRALAAEGAARNVTANVIAPGYIGTDMVAAMDEGVLREQILPQIPVRRLGLPEEVARCVGFLASERAGYITGSTLSVNGGQHMS